jgi:hypothetical protein
MIIPSLECIRQNTPVICIVRAGASDVHFATMRPGGRVASSHPLAAPRDSYVYSSYLAASDGKSNYGTAGSEIVTEASQSPSAV